MENKKEGFRIQIPFVLRFALVWTLFFSIIGIIIQSINAQSFIFKEFFAENFIGWFKDFGTFTSKTAYLSSEEIFYAILEKWYYFLYTGGLLALIWGLLEWVINFEISLKARDKQIPIQEREIKEPVKIVEVREVSPTDYHSTIEQWLEEGWRLLSEGKLEEARLIHEQLRKEYNPEIDSSKILYNRIKDFYEEIIKE